MNSNDVSIYEELKVMLNLCNEQLSCYEKMDNATSNQEYEHLLNNARNTRTSILEQCNKIFKYYETEKFIEKDKRRIGYVNEIEGKYFMYGEHNCFVVKELGQEELINGELWFKDCLVVGINVNMFRDRFDVRLGSVKLDIRYNSLKSATKDDYDNLYNKYVLTQK